MARQSYRIIRREPERRSVGPLAGMSVGLAALLVLSACTPGQPPSGPSPTSPSAPSAPGSSSRSPGETAAPDPEDVPPDDTDYSKDAGNDPKKYTYEPDVEPAESVVATLCNLTQVFFKGLRTVDDGTAVVDSNLRTNIVGVEDLMDYWGTLRDQFPDSAADIDTAHGIYEQWSTALLEQENGEDAAAKKAMAAGEELIEKLPKTAAAECR